jgi:hypothetical protein
MGLLKKINTNFKNVETEKNIDRTTPNAMTEPHLVDVYNQLMDKGVSSLRKSSLLDELGKVYHSLKLDDVLSGANSFIRPTLERIASGSDPKLKDHLHKSCKILQVTAVYLDFYDWLQPEQSGFIETLDEITLVKNSEQLLKLYAIAKHGAKAGCSAINQLIVLSKDAFPHVSNDIKTKASQLKDQLLHSPILKIKGSRINSYSRTEITEAAFKREEIAQQFKTIYGIRPEKIQSVGQLKEVIGTLEGGKNDLIKDYIDALPQLVSGQTQKTITDLWHNDYITDDYHFDISKRIPLSNDLWFEVPVRTKENHTYDIGVYMALQSAPWDTSEITGRMEQAGLEDHQAAVKFELSKNSNPINSQIYLQNWDDCW